MKKYTTVGKIHQSHGLEGKLKVSFEAFFLPFIKELKFIFVKTNSASPVPWFVEYVSVKSPKSILMQLEGLNSRADAEQLNGKPIQVPSSDYPQLEESLDETEEWNFAIGFELLDADHNSIGKIKDVFYTSYQALATILINNEEVLIPLHQDFILELDEEKKQMVLDLPEGLLDL